MREDSRTKRLEVGHMYKCGGLLKYSKPKSIHTKESSATSVCALFPH